MKNHGNHTDHDDGTLSDITADGAAAFSELRSSIHGTLWGLNRGFEPSEQGDLPVEGTVHVHLDHITTLLEAGNAESSGNVFPSNPGNTLDLDAARNEISSRLVKLVKQRGD